MLESANPTRFGVSLPNNKQKHKKGYVTSEKYHRSPAAPRGFLPLQKCGRCALFSEMEGCQHVQIDIKQNRVEMWNIAPISYSRSELTRNSRSVLASSYVQQISTKKMARKYRSVLSPSPRLPFKLEPHEYTAPVPDIGKRSQQKNKMLQKKFVFFGTLTKKGQEYDLRPQEMITGRKEVGY